VRRAALLAAGLLLALAGCNAHPTGVTRSESYARFAPDAATHWQIQLSGAFDATVTADVYDLDPYTTEQSTVTDIVAAGNRAICHLDVGASDLSLPDAAALPASVLGNPDGPGRRWLDIRQWSVLEPVLAARFELCRTKGFQGVDADQDDGYAHASGFALTSADAVTFDRRTAALAHAYGLAAGLRTAPAMVPRIAPVADFTVVDGCFTTPDCADYFAFVEAGKAVYDVETGPGRQFCALARVYGFTAIGKPDDQLDGRVTDC
jgi:hypothetical protein